MFHTNQFLTLPKNNYNEWLWEENQSEFEKQTTKDTLCPKISIITPSYNQGSYIEETIRSVLLQGYPNLEYIIIDGGSTDDTVEIIRKYEKWISYWVSEKDFGQSHALNKGFNRATGDIFAYLNSDDLLMPGVLKKIALAFSKHTNELYIVNCSGYFLLSDGRIVSNPAFSVNPEIYLWLNAEVSILQPATFWTKKLHNKIGGFREDLYFCFDKDFFINAIFKHGKYEYHKNIDAAIFRIHDDSKSCNQLNTMWRENYNLWNEYKKDDIVGKKYLEKIEQLKLNLNEYGLEEQKNIYVFSDMIRYLKDNKVCLTKKKWMYLKKAFKREILIQLIKSRKYKSKYVCFKLGFNAIAIFPSLLKDRFFLSNFLYGIIGKQQN